MISKKFFINQASELTKKWIRHNVSINFKISHKRDLLHCFHFVVIVAGVNWLFIVCLFVCLFVYFFSGQE